MSKARQMVREVLKRDLERVRDRGPLVSTAFEGVSPKTSEQMAIRAEANEWFEEEHKRNVKYAEERLARYSD